MQVFQAKNQALRSQSLPHLLTVRIALSQRLLCPIPQQLYMSTMLRLMLDQVGEGNPFRGKSIVSHASAPSVV